MRNTALAIGLTVTIMFGLATPEVFAGGPNPANSGYCPAGTCPRQVFGKGYNGWTSNLSRSSPKNCESYRHWLLRTASVQSLD